jgi:hypothetical protein
MPNANAKVAAALMTSLPFCDFDQFSNNSTFLAYSTLLAAT